jgi:hypothetical protein
MGFLYPIAHRGNRPEGVLSGRQFHHIGYSDVRIDADRGSADRDPDIHIAETGA